MLVEDEDDEDDENAVFRFLIDRDSCDSVLDNEPRSSKPDTRCFEEFGINTADDRFKVFGGCELLIKMKHSKQCLPHLCGQEKPKSKHSEIQKNAEHSQMDVLKRFIRKWMQFVKKNPLLPFECNKSVAEGQHNVEKFAENDLKQWKDDFTGVRKLTQFVQKNPLQPVEINQFVHHNGDFINAKTFRTVWHRDIFADMDILLNALRAIRKQPNNEAFEKKTKTLKEMHQLGDSSAAF